LPLLFLPLLSMRARSLSDSQLTSPSLPPYCW